MKKYLLLFNRYIILFATTLSPLLTFSQISPDFNKALPDSLRPKSANKLHYTDLTKIFVYVVNTENLEERFQTETKALFHKYGFGYDNIKNKKNRLDFIIAAHDYARNAIENKKLAINLIIALKKELDKNSEGYEYYLVQYYFMNNWFLNYNKANKIVAYENLIKCLNLSKKIKDSASIKTTFYFLSYFYGSLRQLQQSINYADSTFQIQRKIKTSNFKLDEMQYHSVKADVYHDFYIATKNKSYIDSSRKYIKLVPFKKDNHVSIFLESTCLLLKAWLYYHEEKYEKSSILLDSLAKFGDSNFIRSPAYFSMKALNNLKTNKSKSESEKLKKIPENYDRSFLGIVYTEAIASAKKNGNFQEAIFYQDRLLKFITSQNIIKSESVIFEREQGNKLNGRDLAISKLNEEKSKTYLWGSVLFFILLLIIIAFYFRARHIRNRRDLLYQQINDLAEAEVIKIQLAEERAKDIERKKMGQELHDDLAGTLASIKIKMENEVENTEDKNSKKRLAQLNQTINNAYQLARNKSHQWFDTDQDTFSGVLYDILERGLPKENYNKEITIDKNSTTSFSSEMMIELIYITKEAITNILKHSKADKVDLLLYDENETTIFQIRDNGKGFETRKNKKGLGMHSMENRVKKIGGQLEIYSNKNGTEIIIKIPKASIG